jgi:hypothetical protein
MITRLGTYSQIKGSPQKIPCRVATTGNITLSSTQTIDGVAVVAGDRVLVWQQSTSANNGIYIVAAGSWTRAVDMSLDDDVFTGLGVYVNSGTTHSGKNFVVTTSNPITLGTTSLTFAQSAGGSGSSGSSGSSGTSGSSGSSGTSGSSGSSGTGFTAINNPATSRVLTANGASTTTANAQANLTYDGTRLTVTPGSIVTGTASATDGSTVLQDNYSNGHLTNFGTNRSSGGVVIGYGVTPSTVNTNEFVSATGISIGRGALSIDDSVRWYLGATQTVTVGNAVTMTQRMILDNNGQLGIGATPAYRLQISGDEYIVTGSLGVNVVPNATDGTVSAGADVIAFASDKRLKTNIRLLENPLSKINKLSGMTFNWNERANNLANYNMDESYVGLFAQDVQSVLPEAVKLAPFDNDGNNNSISGENYLTVQYEKIVPLLIEAIKELEKEVNKLKNKI